MSGVLYYEDFHVGQVLTTDHYRIDKDHAVAFAQAYDPQAQHLDEELAKDSLFGAMVVSGWHTAAISMRLKLSSDFARVAAGVVGLGLESVRWPRPVYPGDTLHVTLTILSMRPSATRPDRGIVKYKVRTYNQHDELVMESVTTVLMPRRPDGA